MEHSPQAFDVVICGGGLAGLTLARQLRREQPSLSVLVVERTSRPLDEASHKVGESSVELGSAYLESLGLRDYILDRHIIKFGLRFFPGGGTRPFEERTEIGPAHEPIVPSYQFDRGRLENDLRAFIEEDGATLWEGATVSSVTLGKGDALHTIEIDGGASPVVSARWLVDATGRNALLRREHKLTRGTKHNAHAGWYRVKGRVDITTLAPESATDWHAAPMADQRWRSTNHLMGEGYWAWTIPLSSGNTSIGLVVHDDPHGFGVVRSLSAVQAFLAEREPYLAKALEAHEVLDFGCVRGYSHNVTRAWSADRWAMVGEAAAFADPLYSPGTDYIGFANVFTGEMIRADLAGEDLTERARDLSLAYRALVNGNVDVYRRAAKVYGHAPAMMMKIYWDNYAYWSYPCQLFLQKLYQLSGEKLGRASVIGQRFVELSGYVQSLVGAWAALDPRDPEPGFRAMPKFPSVIIDAHLALQERWDHDQALEYCATQVGRGDELLGELLIRVLGEVGDENAEALFESAGAAKWNVAIDPARIAAESLVGMKRRKALSSVARDVERSLGLTPRRLSSERLGAILAPLLAEPAAAES